MNSCLHLHLHFHLPSQIQPFRFLLLIQPHILRSSKSDTSSSHQSESFRRPVSFCNVFLGLVLERSSGDQVSKQRPNLYLIMPSSPQYHEPILIPNI